MKKSLVWILAAMAPLALVACGSSEPAEAPAPAPETSTAGDEVETLMKDAADALSDGAEEAGDAVDVTVEEAKEAGSAAKESVEEAGSAAKETAVDVAEDAEAAVEAAADSTAETADELMEDAAEVVGGGDAHEKLIGTNWQVGDFKMEFQSEEAVKISGGALATIAPDGLDAEYTYEDGAIVLSAMGQTREGTWDGENLVIDGNEGVLLPES